MGVDPFAALGIDQGSTQPPSPQMSAVGGDEMPVMRITPSKKGGLDPFAVLGIDPSAATEPVPSATPAIQPGQTTGMRANIGAGIKEGVIGTLAGIAGAPADLVTRLPNAALGAAGLPQIPTTTDALRDVLYSVGGTPDQVVAGDNAQSVGRAAARGAGAMLAGGPLGAVAGEAGLASAGSVGGALTGALGGGLGEYLRQNVPARFGPAAEFGGNLLGALGGQGMLVAGKGISNAVTGAVGRMGIAAPQIGWNESGIPGMSYPTISSRKLNIPGVETPVTPSQAVAAGQTVQAALGPEGIAELARVGQNEARAQAIEKTLADPNKTPAERIAAQRELNTIGPDREQQVSGAQPTVAQLVPTEKTVALDRDMRTLNNPQFATRDAQNNAAMVGALQGLAPASAGPEAVSNLFLQKLDALEATQTNAVSSARSGVTDQTEALGGQDPPRLYGQQIRGQLQSELAPVHKATSDLWAQVDPDNKWALSAKPLTDTAARLKAELSPTTNMDSQEGKLLARAANLPPVVKFSELSQIRKDTNAAVSRLSGEKGFDPNVRRLTILKQGIDQAIAEAVDHIDSAEGGVIDRMQGRGSAGGSVEGAVGGSGNTSNSGGGPPGVAPQGGGRVLSGGRPGGLAGDSAVAPAGANRQPASAQTAGLSQPSARQAESLVDFLVSRGGIKDQGGELAANDLQLVHHRAGGRLVNNTRGMPLDAAREAAAEAGFIRPNADINDFLDAVTSHQPVYRISDAADEANRAAQIKQAALESHEHFMAGANVDEAAAGLGVRLSPAEIDHATRLTMYGMHPEDAVKSATREAEENVFDRNAQYNAIGSPGVPLAARQAEMPMDAARLAPNFEAKDAAAYKAANAATRDEKQRFGQGAVGQVLQKGRFGEDFRVAEGDVPRRIFTRGASEPGEVERFITAVGGPDKAADVGRNVLVQELRDRKIIDPDGTLNTGKFAAWQKARAATVDQFPGLGAKFRDAQEAQVTLDRTTAQHTAALRDFQNGAAKHFLNADPQVAVGRVFSSGNSAQVARQLYSAVKDNPDALAGLRRGFVDLLDQKFNVDRALLEAGTTLKSKSYRDFMDQHRNAFKIVFGGQGAQNIDLVESMLNRQAKAKQMEATVGSNTVQKALGAAKHAGTLGGSTLFAILGEKLAEHASHAVSGHGLVSLGAGAVGLAGGLYLNSLRQAGIATRNALTREMMLNPDLTRALMQRADAASANSVPVQRRIAAALQSTVLNQATPKERTQ